MFIQCHENGQRLELKSLRRPPNETLDVSKKEILLIHLLLDHIDYKMRKEA